MKENQRKGRGIRSRCPRTAGLCTQSWVPGFLSGYGTPFQFLVYCMCSGCELLQIFFYLVWVWTQINLFNKSYIVGTETPFLLMRGGCGIKRSREGARPFYNISYQSFFTYKTGSGVQWAKLLFNSFSSKILGFYGVRFISRPEFSSFLLHFLKRREQRKLYHI